MWLIYRDWRDNIGCAHWQSRDLWDDGTKVLQLFYLCFGDVGYFWFLVYPLLRDSFHKTLPFLFIDSEQTCNLHTQRPLACSFFTCLIVFNVMTQLSIKVVFQIESLLLLQRILRLQFKQLNLCCLSVCNIKYISSINVWHGSLPWLSSGQRFHPLV